MTHPESLPYRPLGHIVTMMESLGTKVTHWHDDLVFMEHNAFLIQMGERGEDMGVWLNIDCEPAKAEEIMDLIAGKGPEHGFDVSFCGNYRVAESDENETLQIEFIA